VQGFDTQLRHAAEAVCDSDSADPVVTQKDRGCVQQIMVQALTKMDRPVLTAMYRANTGAANVGYATGF
jgi:UrcA family protein